ncbi:hypothetical protein WA577_003825, partial [Blastocystis sp. JDR]
MLSRGASMLAMSMKASNPVFTRSFYNKLRDPILNLSKVKSITILFGGLSEGSTGTREFASQISGKRVKNSNPKASVNIVINNELTNPKVEVEYANGFKSSKDTTNMSFKRILHMVQDEMMEVENEMDKANYDKFRAQEHDYIMSEIKRWEDLHKKMIK